jgi:peptidylprolyl isomerase domain and WD repeat-containing protein 1
MSCLWIYFHWYFLLLFVLWSLLTKYMYIIYYIYRNDLVSGGRDVFNERPPKEEQTIATKAQGHHLGTSATIHTTMGDITMMLFPNECPKTVENFTTHSKNGYYNGLIFHRVIKGFMVQTGDPLGNIALWTLLF